MYNHRFFLLLALVCVLSSRTVAQTLDTAIVTLQPPGQPVLPTKAKRVATPLSASLSIQKGLATSVFKQRAVDIIPVRKNGTHVFAFVDLLHWVTVSTPATEDVFVKHPDLAERNFEGMCGAIADGKYASPFSSQVKTALNNFIAQVALEPAQSFNGILLRSRLQEGSLLGYSDVARLSYINKFGIDPIDISVSSRNAEDAAIANQWIDWRLQQVANFINLVSMTYKARKPKGRVAVTGSADWVFRTRGQKNTSLEDWPTWAASGTIDEIVLEGDWNMPQGRVDYAASKAALDFINAKLQAASKTKRAPVKLTILIPLRDANGRALDPLSQLLTLQGQGVKSIMLQVTDASDLPRANEFISQTLPSVQAMLQ